MDPKKQAVITLDPFGIVGIYYTKPLVESKQLRKNFRRICDVNKKIRGWRPDYVSRWKGAQLISNIQV